MKKYKKIVIIPAYNEEENIEKVISKIKEVASDFDYIVINDCSIDNTLEICRKNKIPVINLPINLGIGGAMQTGYLYAKQNNYDIAVQIDGDGQHDPDYLKRLVEPIEMDKYDFVTGSRFIEKEGFQSSVLRRIGINYFRVLLKMLIGKSITDATSGFRACNKDIIEYFAKHYPSDYPEPEAIVALARKKYRIIEVAVKMKEREQGFSSIRSFKTVYYMIKVTLAILINKIKTI